MMKQLCAVVLLLIVCECAFATESTGNEQLRNAINAALAEITVYNEWFPISQPFSVGNHTQNCPQATEYAPYPSTPIGTLQNIISSGKIKLGISFTFPPMSFVNTSGQLDGFETVLFTRVVQRIASHYNTSIEIQWVNTDGQSFWGLVADGSVDGLVDTIVPGQYNVTALTTTTQIGNQACSHLTTSIGLLAGPSFTSALSVAAINSASIKIGTYAISDTVRTEIKNSAPSANLGTYWAPSYEVLFQWLANGTIDVAAAYSATLNYELNRLDRPSNYQLLDLGVQNLKVFSTRRDALQTPASDRIHAVDGNEQMMFAFQAFLANYYASGAWSASQATYGLGPRLQTCVNNQSWYSYPKTPMSGTLKTVLQNRTLNMCYLTARPYFYSNGAANTGFYYDMINKFAAALSQQYNVPTIKTTFRVAVESPTFSSVYNHSCHGFIGSFIPGSLGLINNTYTTTATRLYQSCAIHSDIVTIVAGPAFTGTFTIDGLNSASITMVSIVGTTTTRNSVHSIIPLAKFNATSQSVDEAYADLAAGRSKLLVSQRGIANAFIANSANPSDFRTLELFDQLLYSVVFYKPENGLPEPDTSSSESSSATPSIITSAIVMSFLLAVLIA